MRQELLVKVCKYGPRDKLKNVHTKILMAFELEIKIILRKTKIHTHMYLVLYNTSSTIYGAEITLFPVDYSRCNLTISFFRNQLMNPTIFH